MFLWGQPHPPANGWGPNTPNFWTCYIYAHMHTSL